MYQSTLQFLQKTISELINCDESEVNPQARLVDNLGFESIDFLELSMILAQQYKLDVNDETLFLSNFRPLIKDGSREQVLQNLLEAYPHLSEDEFERMINEASKGNVLTVDHVTRYIEYHARN